MTRVAVVGPGSVGIVFAAHLAAAGHDVIACARRSFSEYRIDSPTHGLDPFPATVLTDPADIEGPVPFVLVAVKAHQTAGAAPWLDGLCGPDTIVVVLQNGVEHDRVVPFIGEASMVPSVVYCAAELIEPGYAVHTNSAHLIVPDTEAGRAVHALFEDCLPEIRVKQDFATPMWLKLSLNVMANGLTALTDRDLSLFSDPAIQPVAVKLLTEAWAIGRAAGADLDDAKAEALVQGLSGRTTGGTSMLYDTRAGRPTEHDAIHGAALRTAAEHGVDAPMIELVHALLETRSLRDI